MRKNRPALFRGRHFEDEMIVLCVRWYLRYSLSYRDLEEMMAERGLAVDHSTIRRWVQRYASIMHQGLRREMRNPNRSWRVDETYIRVGGRWAYLYRAVGSDGETIDFMLSPYRDPTAAKHFLRLALSSKGRIRPRVINVDGHPAYARAISELRQSGQLGRRCRCRPSPYLKNISEQDHRFIKKRIATSLWFRSVDGALNTIDRYEAMNMIRKGQVRWLAKAMRLGKPSSSSACSVSLRNPRPEFHLGPSGRRYLQQVPFSCPWCRTGAAIPAATTCGADLHTNRVGSVYLQHRARHPASQPVPARFTARRCQGLIVAQMFT